MYTTGITEQVTLEHEYNMVIKALRALPTHVFLMQLMEGEIGSPQLASGAGRRLAQIPTTHSRTGRIWKLR